MNLKRIALRILIALNIVAIPEQDAPMCINPDFESEVRKYLVYSIPTISVAEASEDKDEYLFLDAREEKEFNTSHIEGAKHVGYKSFDIDSVKDIDKDTPIVIYCSIGYRSEIIGTKLKDAGFTSVKNMYGSIFEWVNQHHPVVNDIGQETKKVHTYNKNWSKWVQNEDMNKIY